MTKDNTENKEPDFASPEAGESWAQAKKEYGDALNIDDVKGTGKDGAIKASDVDAYVEALTGGDADKAKADKEAKAKADEKAKADAQETPKLTAKDFKEVKPIKGKKLENLTGNPFEIEGTKIAPNGNVELTDALAKSKRVAHGIEIGVLAVK